MSSSLRIVSKFTPVLPSISFSTCYFLLDFTICFPIFSRIFSKFAFPRDFLPRSAIDRDFPLFTPCKSPIRYCSSSSPGRGLLLAVHELRFSNAQSFSTSRDLRFAVRKARFSTAQSFLFDSRYATCVIITRLLLHSHESMLTCLAMRICFSRYVSRGNKSRLLFCEIESRGSYFASYPKLSERRLPRLWMSLGAYISIRLAL
ncbi:DNA polymerase III subunit delta [Striga asiatica]|uniref:DNA polymerase III subunit delta n=1 Tax=Striga asiatica TaxID=4170 RepID=A0A5A7QSC1_STRAF|nr:DNA polymerase III subunit delta [Striga asiatica]